jgi:hypothetical protein
MIEKERILSELNLKSLETKNENKWNEQTIVSIPNFLCGIINFSLTKLDDNILSHIKTIIESIDSLDKIARKHLEENREINEKKDFWDLLSPRIKQNNIYLRFVIFYSDLTFRLKYRVSDSCKEKICPSDYYIGVNFTKDLTMESVFSEVYPVHIKFGFRGYPVINIDENISFKAEGIEGVIEEISVFNGKDQQCADDNQTGKNIYARCPQSKGVSITISLDKLHKHYVVFAEYAHKNIPVNSNNMNGFWIYRHLNFEGTGILRANNIYPIKWLKRHNQENSGIISIPVKNKENFYINCEIKDYKIKRIEIIEDTEVNRKLEMDIYKEDIL